MTIKKNKETATADKTRKMNGVPEFPASGDPVPLKEVTKPMPLQPGTWCRERETFTMCFALPRGGSLLDSRL